MLLFEVEEKVHLAILVGWENVSPPAQLRLELKTEFSKRRKAMDL
jgi:hypothetical protein